MKKMQFIRGVSEIAANYDYYIVDQWGVLHNGKTIFPNVYQCMNELINSGKQMILLSNSSRRADNTIKGLNKLGFEHQKYFKEIITSGEIAWHMIRERKIPFLKKTNSIQPLKAFVLGNGEDDESYVTSAGLTFSDPERADFILVRGTFTVFNGAEKFTFRTARELIDTISCYLEKCYSRQLPMIIPNPDLIRPDEESSPMPGKIGEMYQSLCAERGPGNEIPIYYLGKPYPLIYQLCLKIFEENKTLLEVLDTISENETTVVPTKSKERICCIGDSLDHDILGAAKQDLDSLWLINGVHCSEINKLAKHSIVSEGSANQPPEEIIQHLISSRGSQTQPTLFHPGVFKMVTVK